MHDYVCTNLIQMIQRLILLFFLVFPFIAVAQSSDKVIVRGVVTNAESGEAVELVTIYKQETQNVVETNARGRYKIEVEPDQPFVIEYRRVGYQTFEQPYNGLPPGTDITVNVGLVPIGADLEVVVTEQRLDEGGMVRENVEPLKLLPTTTGNFESVLPHIALGASSGTGGELSSQYNVRGGNYDENLVYVNDFEIYRPQLIRSGQQEGLSFPNIDLIKQLKFSSGGFEAKYGDKLSSVLDIQYKRPDSTAASASVSLLGATAHLEGSIANRQNSYKKFRYLIGARYKTNRYLLSALPVEGEYSPDFVDIQTYLTYDLTRDLQVGFLGNFNQSKYNFVPVSSDVAQGLIDFALRLRTSFQGSEADEFTTGMGGLSLTYLPEKEKNPIFLKLLASTYQSKESEQFDIIGDYRLSQIETGLGSDNAGEEILVLGTGIQHLYTRNLLVADVTNIEHRGGVEVQSSSADGISEKVHFLQWSLKYQSENIFDKINEWERLDSAGYSLPYDPSTVQLRSVLKSQNDLTSNRYSFYLQDSYSNIRLNQSEIRFTAGVRGTYWDLNNEFLISPRFQFLYKPMGTEKDISFRLAAGIYNQAPFYRELRRPDGTVNLNLKSQKSLHIVAGMTSDFGPEVGGKKKFRLITEAYYKKLWDLVSYELDNVRIRYSGENDATGYVAGLDLRVNGEFVPGAESWFNLSLLRAREKLNDVEHLRREIGETDASIVNDVPRPTDHAVRMNIFFQDYLPSNENFKVHVNLSYGTGLPFGLKDNNRIYRNTYRFKSYQRVDIGFSLALWEQKMRQKSPRHPLRFTRSSWLSLEVYNLLDIRNEASNTWIKTVYNQQFAISNYLTSRRVNVRFRVEL